MVLKQGKDNSDMYTSCACYIILVSVRCGWFVCVCVCLNIFLKLIHGKLEMAKDGTHVVTIVLERCYHMFPKYVVNTKPKQRSKT